MTKRAGAALIDAIDAETGDPRCKALAMTAAEVADEIERRQREQRVRLYDDVVADGPAEIILRRISTPRTTETPLWSSLATK